jgi:AmmeMemoRadiSam system protein B
MNHYQSDEMTRKKDNLALEHVLNLDSEGLLKTCAREGITMCGVVTMAITIEASKALGAKKAELVSYATSGDTTGDYSSVVGYAGVVIK